MSLSNLPPGVTESMIPGNRPEDVLFEELADACEPIFRELFYHVGSQEVLEFMKERLEEVFNELAFELDKEEG